MLTKESTVDIIDATLSLHDVGKNLPGSILEKKGRNSCSIRETT